MLTKTKKVYYCEFCKKHGLSAGSMATHEKHCTANPDRICRLCGETNIRKIIEELKTKIETKKIHGDIDGFSFMAVVRKPALSEFEQECPICTLAILRCTGLNMPWFEIKYDYSKKMEEWWMNANEAEKKAEYQDMLAEGMDL